MPHFIWVVAVLMGVLAFEIFCLCGDYMVGVNLQAERQAHEERRGRWGCSVSSFAASVFRLVFFTSHWEPTCHDLALSAYHIYVCIVGLDGVLF